MSEIKVAGIKPLNTVVYEGKSFGLRCADKALYLASAALGYEDIKLNEAKFDSQDNLVFQGAKKVNNLFVRFLCALGALLTLPVALVGLCIKRCMQNKQTEQIEKYRQKFLPIKIICPRICLQGNPQEKKEEVKQEELKSSSSAGPSIKANDVTYSSTPVSSTKASKETTKTVQENSSAPQPQLNASQGRKVQLSPERKAYAKLEAIGVLVKQGYKFKDVEPLLKGILKREYADPFIKETVEELLLAGKQDEEKNAALEATRKEYTALINEVGLAFNNGTLTQNHIDKLKTWLSKDIPQELKERFKGLIHHSELLLQCKQNTPSSQVLQSLYMQQSNPADNHAIIQLRQILAGIKKGDKIRDAEPLLNKIMQKEYSDPVIKQTALGLLKLVQEDKKTEAYRIEFNALADELAKAAANATLSQELIDKLKSFLDKDSPQQIKDRVKEMISVYEEFLRFIQKKPSLPVQQSSGQDKVPTSVEAAKLKLMYVAHMASKGAKLEEVEQWIQEILKHEYSDPTVKESALKMLQIMKEPQGSQTKTK